MRSALMPRQTKGKATDFGMELRKRPTKTDSGEGVALASDELDLDGPEDIDVVGRTSVDDATDCYRHCEGSAETDRNVFEHSSSKEEEEEEEEEEDKQQDSLGSRKSAPFKPKASSPLRNILCYVIIIVVVVLAVILASYALPDEINPLSSKQSADEDYDYPKIFKNGLQKLELQFKNQTTRFWRILKTRGLSHLKEKEPRQPLVILLGAPPSAHKAVNCLVSKIATILDPEVENIENVEDISGEDYQRREGDIAKKILDKELHDIFTKGRRVAVVRNLELLPPPSENLFYAFCDNDNAHYKHAAILFTVNLPRDPSPSLSPVEAEGTIEKYLYEEVWNKASYSRDAVAALLSRIADTVVLANGETDETINLICKP